MNNNIIYEMGIYIENLKKKRILFLEILKSDSMQDQKKLISKFRKNLKHILLLFTAVLFLTTHLRSKDLDSRPNVIFILADDLGWADLPVYGNKFNEATNLDKLASEGVRFTNAYAACPVCSPTRASIMSGQYPARVGIIDFIPGHWRPYEEVIVPVNRTQYLPLEVITIGEAMKAAGYVTGYFGKWHLGDSSEYHPLNQGFDEANIEKGSYYNVKFKPPRSVGSPKRLSELLTDFGVEFIENNRDRPFFLFLAHFDVHVQLDADQDLIDKYLHKTKISGYPCNVVYAAMIEHIDRSVGRITKKLEELGLTKNTVIVFFSDNGGLDKRADNNPLIADSKKHIYKNDSLLYIATSNKPLRGFKGSLNEGGIREPLMVKWPGRIAPGSVSDEVVTSVDFFPTLIELAGGTLPKGQVFDGKSLIPELMGISKNNNRAIFWHYPVYHHEVPSSAVRKDNWKLIQNLISNKYELYNLKDDIGELNDLSSLYPDKVKELAILLDQWRSNVGARFPTANPEFDINRRFFWGKHPTQIKLK